MAEIKYEIKEQLAVLSEGAKGWTKELNLISWNDREPKYDIREWAPDHFVEEGATELRSSSTLSMRTLKN